MQVNYTSIKLRKNVNNSAVKKKKKENLPYDLAIPHLESYPPKNENICPFKDLNVHSTIIHNNPNCRNPDVHPLVNG